MFAWQATVQDEAGNAVPLPVVTVYEEDGGALADIYGEDGSPLENPFTGTMEGFLQFWAEPGKYRVSGVSGAGETQEWHIEGGGVELGLDALTSFETRADMVAALDSLSGSQDGRVVWAGGLAYIRDSGSDDIPDLPGWKPVGVAEVANFGGDIESAFSYAGGNPVDFGNNSWPNDSPSGYYNLYDPSQYKVAIGNRRQVGSRALGITTDNANPIEALVKTSSATRDVNPNEWDQVHYVHLDKLSGDAFGAAASAFVSHRGGAGDLVAGHHRAQASHGDAEVFATWSYASSRWLKDDFAKDLIGHEIDIVSGMSAVWDMPPNKGRTRGLLVVTADGSLAGHTAIEVGKGVSAAEGWLQGINLRADAIEPSGDADTRQLTVAGTSSIAGRYGGIKFTGSHFTYGIDARAVTGPFVNNVFMRLSPGQRISWLAGNVERSITVTEGGSFNLDQATLSINGTRVLSLQRPAIPNAASGTEVSTINAILTALRGHGIIAT